MPINISDFVINIGQTHESLDWETLAAALIGLGGTFGAALGGAYLGAWLTDLRQVKEVKQNNIDKTLFLHSFIEKYIIQLHLYNEKVITPNLESIQSSEYPITIVRNPYTSYKIDLKMRDYEFFLKENKDLWNILYQVIHLADSMDYTVIAHDKIAQEPNKYENKDEELKKATNTIKALSETYKNLLFFSLLLYKNLNILLSIKYNQQFTCSDRVMEMCNFNNEDIDDIQKGWIKGLEESWKN